MKNKILPVLLFVFLSVCGMAQADDATTIPLPRPASPVLYHEADSGAVYQFSEIMPDFPGGQDSLNAFLRRNIKFPKYPDAEGTVYISFIIEKNGSISNVTAVKETPGAPEFTKEAFRVILLMPKWKPGKMQSGPVRVKMILPVRFRVE